jgi:excisionase family DNA binding protein
MARQALYTVKEACDALFAEGYSEASRKRVRRWISNGQIKAIQDGSRFFIPRGEIAKMGGDIGSESNKLDA